MLRRGLVHRVVAETRERNPLIDRGDIGDHFCTISQAVSRETAIFFSFPFSALMVTVKPHAPELTTTFVMFFLVRQTTFDGKRAGRKQRPGNAFPPLLLQLSPGGVRGDNPIAINLKRNLFHRRGRRDPRE